MRRGSAVAVVLVAGVLAAGCGGGDTNEAQSSTTTTTAAATTTGPPATTATTPPTVPSAPVTIPSKSDGVSADGSGCAPPSGDTLPDGIWFGDLKAVDVNAATLSLDLNCFFTDEAANHAAKEDDPNAEVPVPDGYYIRNKINKIYVLPAVANVAVFKLSQQGAGPLEPAGNGLAAAASMLSEFNTFWIGWLEISGGKVVDVQQQFVP